MPRNLFWLIFFCHLLNVSLANAEIIEDFPLREKKSLYEIGIGGGSGFFPHYPGSDQVKWRSILAPAIRYRGWIFRADEEEGARAKLVTKPRYGVELSGSGTFPAPSEENSARTGMPDLDLLGEIGPQFYYVLKKGQSFQTRFILPFRSAFSTDFAKVLYRGYTLTPGFDVRMIFPESSGALRFRTTAYFASTHYQEYYFDVAEAYATVERPAYFSKGGYLGTRADMTYSVEWGRLGFFLSLAYNNFQNSINDESPLFKTKHTFSGVFGFSWFLYRSDAKEEDRP